MSVIVVRDAQRIQVVAPLPGVLAGTTAVAGSPDMAVQRRVQLFVSGTLNAHGQVFPTTTIVDWIWSDAAGRWEFRGLDPAKTYGIIAYDHTGQYDPVIKLGLVPSVE